MRLSLLAPLWGRAAVAAAAAFVAASAWFLLRQKRKRAVEKGGENAGENFEVTGLLNSGNLCFMNSVFQMLAAAFLVRPVARGMLRNSESSPAKRQLCECIARLVEIRQTFEVHNAASFLACIDERLLRLRQEVRIGMRLFFRLSARTPTNFCWCFCRCLKASTKVPACAVFAFKTRCFVPIVGLCANRRRSRHAACLCPALMLRFRR